MNPSLSQAFGDKVLWKDWFSQIGPLWEKAILWALFSETTLGEILTLNQLSWMELKLIFLLLNLSKPQLSEQSGLAVFASDWSYLPSPQAAAAINPPVNIDSSPPFCGAGEKCRFYSPPFHLSSEHWSGTKRRGSSCTTRDLRLTANCRKSWDLEKRVFKTFSSLEPVNIKLRFFYIFLWLSHHLFPPLLDSEEPHCSPSFTIPPTFWKAASSFSSPLLCCPSSVVRGSCAAAQTT